jgi:hypothetical protein
MLENGDNKFTLILRNNTVYSVFFSHHRQRYHDFKYFGQYIKSFILVKIHVLGFDNDPDWPDPDRHAQDADLYRIRQNDADLHPDTDPQYTAEKKDLDPD